MDIAIRVEPPIETWRLADRPGPDRAALIDAVNRRARRLGTASMTAGPPVLATGHQAWLWHPGILAKTIAAACAARRLGARPLHLVVDQDAHEALVVELPRSEGRRLSVESLRLAPHDATVPTGWQPPVDAAAVIESLRAAGGAADLVRAFEDLPACLTLAEQLAVVLHRLMRPLVGDLPIVTSGDLLSAFDPGHLLRDARACAEAYNGAVAAEPRSGVAPLRIEAQRVELPLWSVGVGRPRARVFADLRASEPAWVTADGRPIDAQRDDLAPRALLLTAIMRSVGCDLFIHGTGGGGPGYDRVTERWWRDWRGQALAPSVLVSADLRLEFDSPVADRTQLRDAVWFRHHLRHNVDRVRGRPDPRKAELFNVRDAAAFERLHRINAELVAAHPELVDEAERAVERARIGVDNAGVAARRDWCFALYPSRSLEALREGICGSVGGGAWGRGG